MIEGEFHRREAAVNESQRKSNRLESDLRLQLDKVRS